MSTSTNSHGKMCKPWLVGHLEFGVCKPSHISNRIYAKNSLKPKDCPTVKLNGQCEHKGHFTWTSNTISLYQNKHVWCLHRVANVNWSQHPHMSSQYDKNVTTSHFDSTCLQSTHLQIARVISSWVDIHVGLTFIIIGITNEWVRFGGVNVGKKSSIKYH